MDFNIFRIDSGSCFSVRKGDTGNFKCWFCGEPENSEQSDKYLHFITFSKTCFSRSENQDHISIMVNPDAELHEWKIVNNESKPEIKNAIEFSLDLQLEAGKDICGTKIGGNPAYINTGHAVKTLEPAVTKSNLRFIMQIDEEDFFPLETPNIDKRIRDCLCGGALYIFAKIDTQNNLIDFTENIIDHQI